MSLTWSVIGALSLGTILLKAAGPLTLGRRQPPPRAMAVIDQLPAAILAGLIVYQTLNDTPSGLAVDARVVGLALGTVAALKRLPMIVVILVAAGGAAATRALT